jgi:hypothetical protein
MIELTHDELIGGDTFLNKDHLRAFIQNQWDKINNDDIDKLTLSELEERVGKMQMLNILANWAHDFDY